MKNPVHENNLTGEIPQPTTSAIIQQRVNSIKYRKSSRTFNIRKSHADITPQLDTSVNRTTLQPENDTLSTNFWPLRPTVTSAQKRPAMERVIKRSQDQPISRPKSHSLQTRNFRTLKIQTGKQKRAVDAVIYNREITHLSQLYELLANVLHSIQIGFVDIERAISEYGQYIRNPKLQFIDDFVEESEVKIRKTLRISRIHEYLSIAYLFLEIAQERMENNESYLINFIGFCLSNLIFVARVYILLEKRPEYEDQNFEKQVDEFEVAAYGEVLRSMEDVVLRMQHNNEIITMIHRKLGRANEKFEMCIRMFLKNAERKNYSTCLCSHYIFEYLSMHIHESELVGISPFLQVAPTPYLAQPQHDYTLVLEPIGILKHGTHLRPYLMQFIKWAAKHFDLVLWSWEMPVELENLTQLLDPFLFAKLYRYHCIIRNQIYTKDLSRLGRSLDKTLIVDFDERIFASTPKNGIVCRWKGRGKEKGLLVLSEILEEMIASQSAVEEMMTFYAEELHAIKGY